MDPGSHPVCSSMHLCHCVLYTCSRRETFGVETGKMQMIAGTVTTEARVMVMTMRIIQRGTSPEVRY